MNVGRLSVLPPRNTGFLWVLEGFFLFYTSAFVKVKHLFRVHTSVIKIYQMYRHTWNYFNFDIVFSRLNKNSEKMCILSSFAQIRTDGLFFLFSNQVRSILYCLLRIVRNIHTLLFTSNSDQIVPVSKKKICCGTYPSKLSFDIILGLLLYW